MSIGPTTLAQFQYLLNEAQDLSFREAREVADKTYTKYTKAGDTSEADFRSATVVGMGPAGITTEFGGTNQDAFEPGTERVTRWFKYTIGTRFSEEFYEDMMKSGRTRKDRVRMLKSLSKEFANSMEWAKESACTLFQTSATSTTASGAWVGAGRDALALASASHVTSKAPAVTISNYVTGSSFSQLHLQECITMLNNQKSEEGRPQAPVKNIGVIYGRFLEWRVPEVLQTQGQVDTANNNINTLKAPGAPKITPILNPYLSDTSTLFQVIDLDNHELYRFEAKEPEYMKERDLNTGAYLHRVVMRFGIDFLSYKGLVHSAGA